MEANNRTRIIVEKRVMDEVLEKRTKGHFASELVIPQGNMRG